MAAPTREALDEALSASLDCNSAAFNFAMMVPLSLADPGGIDRDYAVQAYLKWMDICGQCLSRWTAATESPVIEWIELNRPDEIALPHADLDYFTAHETAGRLVQRITGIQAAFQVSPETSIETLKAAVRFYLQHEPKVDTAKLEATLKLEW